MILISCTVFERSLLFLFDSLFSFNFLFSLTPCYFSSYILFPLKFRKKRLTDFWIAPLKSISSLPCSFFSRKFYFARYLSHFLIGFISSKLFVYKLKCKISKFLKGNLFLEEFSFDIFLITETV